MWERNISNCAEYYHCSRQHSVPPVHTFARVHSKDYMPHGAPTASLGLTHRNGWITDGNYASLKSFANFIKCSQDNHKSHVNIKIIQFAWEKGITLLSFSPHTSHRLQPFDVSVYRPFEACILIDSSHETTKAYNRDRYRIPIPCLTNYKNVLPYK